MNIYGPAELLTESHPSCVKSSYFPAPAKIPAARDILVSACSLSPCFGKSDTIDEWVLAKEVIRFWVEWEGDQMVGTAHMFPICVHWGCVGICGGGLGVAVWVRRLFRPKWRWVAPCRQICVHSIVQHISSPGCSILPPPAPHLGSPRWRKAGEALETSGLEEASRIMWNVGKGSRNMGPPIWLNPSQLFLELIHSCVFTFYQRCGIRVYQKSGIFIVSCFRWNPPDWQWPPDKETATATFEETNLRTSELVQTKNKQRNKKQKQRGKYKATEKNTVRMWTTGVLSGLKVNLQSYDIFRSILIAQNKRNPHWW